MGWGIKFQLGMVICWRNRFVFNGVTINDRCFNGTFEEYVKPRI
jgi:hypothetical protein